MTLQDFKDGLSRAATGMTKDEALAAGICIECKRIPVFYTEAGRGEYRISGSCEPCFDLTCTDPDDLCRTCEKPVEWHTYAVDGACVRFTAKDGA